MADRTHSTGWALESVIDTQSDDVPAEVPASTAAVYDQYAEFVWTSLQYLGARAETLEDLFQETFVVIHKRLASFSGTGTFNAWLFGVCVRVVAAHRRRAHVRRERATDSGLEPEERPDASEPFAAPTRSPEESAIAAEGRAVLLTLLDQLDLEKRAVFVMFELESLPCEAIASTLGVPVGTVYSRLYAARRDFESALARFNARHRHAGR